jgi:hypothetical protein
LIWDALKSFIFANRFFIVFSCFFLRFFFRDRDRDVGRAPYVLWRERERERERERDLGLGRRERGSLQEGWRIYCNK